MTTPTVVFLDRDGTIVRDTEYLSKPEQLDLLPGAAHAISRLNQARVPVIVVTNQSGIARGLFTEEEYKRVEKRLAEMLQAQGAHIDATYFCPHHPDFSVRCNCRKPGTALFKRAAAELHLDMSFPAFVGDRWRDIAAVRELGGTAVLVRAPSTPAGDESRAVAENGEVRLSLDDAVDRLLGPTRVAS